MHISKSTCTAWGRELEAEIADRERERLEELYTLYGMSKAGRIQRLGDTLAQLDTAIAAKDLAELPAEKLLDLKLKYERELKAEYVEPGPQIAEDSLEALLDQYKSVLDRSKRGEITPAQTKAELMTLIEAQKTMKAIDTRDNPFGFAGNF